MRIVFLTLADINNIEERGIYTDLLREFVINGHELTVVCPYAKNFGQTTKMFEYPNHRIIKVKTGNIQKVGNLIEKGLATITLEYLFKKAIKTYLSQCKFDLVLYTTPPVTLANVVKYIKQRDLAVTYLLLKDIFPQGALDLGLISKFNPFYWYFRYKEQLLYKLSDHIGCMSPANVQFILNSNSFIDPAKTEVCPNSIMPIPFTRSTLYNTELRAKYGIPKEAVVCLYGGNLGVAQGIEFINEVMLASKEQTDRFFLIVGSGAKSGLIADYIKNMQIANAKYLDVLPKDDYDRLIHIADIGLIFLNEQFTIPNFPSRLTAYMEAHLPILSATDIHSDLNTIIKDANCGFGTIAGDLGSFNQALDTLCHSSDLRTKMGDNARKYLEAHYTTAQSYQIIMKHFGEDYV